MVLRTFPDLQIPLQFPVPDFTNTVLPCEAARERGDAEVYAPAIWRWILLVIRHLPRFLMRRIGF